MEILVFAILVSRFLDVVSFPNFLGMVSAFPSIVSFTRWLHTKMLLADQKPRLLAIKGGLSLLSPWVAYTHCNWSPSLDFSILNMLVGPQSLGVQGGLGWAGIPKYNSLGPQRRLKISFGIIHEQRGFSIISWGETLLTPRLRVQGSDNVECWCKLAMQRLQ